MVAGYSDNTNIRAILSLDNPQCLIKCLSKKINLACNEIRNKKEQTTRQNVECKDFYFLCYE